MLNLILTLLGIGTRSANYSLTQANLIYYRLVRIVFVLIGLVLAGFGLNLLGIKGINLFMSLIFTIATIIIWSKPINLAIVAGVGALIEKLQENQKFSQGAEKFLGYYIQLLQQILLWGSIILFFLGTLSFQENPKAFIGMLATIILTSLVKIVWGIGGELGKKFIYYYATTMIVVFALTLIPSQLWIKLTGYDIKGVVHMSESGKMAIEIKSLHEENADKKRVARLRQIRDKVSREEILTPSEKAFFKNALEEEQRSSIPARVSSLVPYVGSSQPKTKVVYYTPSAQPQDVYIGEGKWNFRIAAAKGYYELPKGGRTKARRTQIPITGEPSRNTTIPLLPCKSVDYYGGALVNLRPNHSAVKSDERGYVTIGLNLPKVIKEVKGKRVKLIFTSIP